MASQILNEQHLKSINDSIDKLKAAQQEIDLAERAGLVAGPNGERLAEAKKTVQGLLDQLQQVKNVYFPNK